MSYRKFRSYSDSFLDKQQVYILNIETELVDLENC